MVRKILAVIFVLSLLVAGFIYNEWKALSKEPEFIILNNSGSVVSVEAKWRDSKAEIESLRNGGRFKFSIRAEASMELKISRPESEVEHKTIGYFTGGSSFTIEIGPVETNVKGI